MNFIDKIAAFVGGILKVALVFLGMAIVLVLAYYMAVSMLAACAVMLTGIFQSVRAAKTGEPPLVSDWVFWFVFFMLGGAMTLLQFMLVVAKGIDARLAVTSFHILSMVAFYLVFRSIAPKLMRHSSTKVQTVVAVLLAVLLCPVYAPIPTKLMYALAWSIVASI